MSVLSVRSASATLLDGRLGHAYDEPAFRQLLGVERRRAGRSHRSFLLVLVSLRPQPGMARRIPASVATEIFAGLSTAVREVDFVGWFRADRVAGAVLAQGADPLSADAARHIGQRITETIADAVGPGMTGRLHLRVLQLRPSQEAERRG